MPSGCWLGGCGLCLCIYDSIVSPNGEKARCAITFLWMALSGQANSRKHGIFSFAFLIASFMHRANTLFMIVLVAPGDIILDADLIGSMLSPEFKPNICFQVFFFLEFPLAAWFQGISASHRKYIPIRAL